MVLATHLVIGGILGRAIGNPIVAFFAGFVSHLALDSIPHWDYTLSSLRGHRDSLDKDLQVNSFDFVRDLAKIGADLLIGGAFLWLGFRLFDWEIAGTVIWGAIGGLFPDFLQFAYLKLRWPSLKQLQRFHLWLHARRHLEDHWPILGPTLQVILVLTVVILARLFLF